MQRMRKSSRKNNTGLKKARLVRKDGPALFSCPEFFASVYFSTDSERNLHFLLSFPGKPRIIESDLYWKELIAGAREREARSFENKIKYMDRSRD